MKPKAPTSGETPHSVRVRALKVSQPLGTFYIGVMAARDLCTVAEFDVRRMIQEERDVERYLGIQRPMNEKRVEQLARYVKTLDASFPTSVVLAVPAVCATELADGSGLELHNAVGSNEVTDGDDTSVVLLRNIARVLDGQHRIKGLMEGLPRDAEFDMPVTIFVDMDLAEQAQVFATVNLEQTKVNKSLAYDLFALAQSRSPVKTCHNVALALDQSKESPFYRRIKRLGVATEGRFSETLSQHQFIEALMPYISLDHKADRDTLLRGNVLEKVNAEESKRLIFRNMFVSDKDLDITENVFNCFTAVKRRWPKAWDEFGRGYMLAKTNGFRALMRFLRPAYLYVGKPGDVVKSDRFFSVLERVPLSDAEFTIDNFKPGTSGESELVGVLKKAIA